MKSVPVDVIISAVTGLAQFDDKLVGRQIANLVLQTSQQGRNTAPELFKEIVPLLSAGKQFGLDPAAGLGLFSFGTRNVGQAAEAKTSQIAFFSELQKLISETEKIDRRGGGRPTERQALLGQLNIRRDDPFTVIIDKLKTLPPEKLGELFTKEAQKLAFPVLDKPEILKQEINESRKKLKDDTLSNIKERNAKDNRILLLEASNDADRRINETKVKNEDAMRIDAEQRQIEAAVRREGGDGFRTGILQAMKSTGEFLTQRATREIPLSGGGVLEFGPSPLGDALSRLAEVLAGSAEESERLRIQMQENTEATKENTRKTAPGGEPDPIPLRPHEAPPTRTFK